MNVMIKTVWHKAGILFLLFFSITCRLQAQTTFPDIDVQHYTFSLTLNDANNVIRGKATISIKFLNNVRSFKLNLVKKNSTGKGMTISAITEGGRPLRFTQDVNTINISSTATAKSVHTYTISYSGIPADGLIISQNKYGHRTFFGDNWPNRAHNWLPCADYPSDKASVDFIVTAPDHYQVIANGVKVLETSMPNHTKLTHWTESAPLAPKVMVIGVADFAIQQSGNVNGIPVYTYVFPEDKEVGFKNYAYAPDILAWYIKKFGPFAFEKLANVQSKTIYGGMENSSAIFYYEDSPEAGNADEELMAHEIAHQWFGDAAGEKTWANLWLSEGFATYMTNCYLEHKYGTDTLKKREAADRKKVIAFEHKRLSPVVDTAVKNNFKQLLNANSYEKGGWALHMLRRKLGDTLFWKGIHAYYAKYKNSNANTADFEQVMEQSSGKDLHTFFKQWLYTAGHPDVRITWKYDATAKTAHFTFVQKQATLFNFPIEFTVDGQRYNVDINSRETSFTAPSAAHPVNVVIDPNVNLLADFEVTAQ
jgi:aminopeptidase N